MPGTVPGSSILEFFNDGKVFITGGTGFLGKALLEKLLRVFHNIDHIYVLIRTKKGKDPQLRMKTLFEDPLFNTLRKEKPDFEKKVTCIVGDVSSLRLGMSDSDYSFLTGEVTHVIHSAATVRFNESLKTAVGINVLGAQEMSIFCTKCVRLKVFVHISTAYSQYYRDAIGEDFYEPPLKGENALNLVNILSEEKLNALTPEFIKPWPNTYCFTKSIAEDVIKERCKSIPTVVFRPGIVMGTAKEPVPGWIDNIYGPTGMIVAVGVGLLRVIRVDEAQVANVIPVDMTVNAILSSAWDVGSNFKKTEIENSVNDCKESVRKTETVPRIYNFVVDDANSLTWGEFLKINLRYGMQTPSKKAIWYYTLTMTKIYFVYVCLVFLLHYIPALLADVALVLLGKKPQMIKTYQKINSFSELMVAFSMKTWKFGNVNLKSLLSRLSDTDKELFNFDMEKINWKSYFSSVIVGVRLYLLNETETALPAARKRMFLFWLGHRLIQFCFIVFWLWILSKLFFAFDSQKPEFKDPLRMPQNLFLNSTK